MRVRIDASPAGHVQVVKALDVGRISVLEGYNGVGKSLAVRVLQACCGQIPYREDDRPWLSFRQTLGPVHAQVDGLVGSAQTLSWRFDSRSWLERTGPITTEWFDELLIDGANASLRDAREVLSVHRVAGDVGVVETLAQQADNYAAAVGQWIARLEKPSSHGSVLAEASALAGGLLSLTSEVDNRQLADDRTAVAQAEVLAKDASDDVAAAQARLDAVAEAETAVQQLAQLRDASPALELQLKEVTEALADAQARRRSLDEQVEAAAGSAALGKGILHDLENAERTLARNVNKLQDALVRLGAALALQELPADEAAVRASLWAAEAELAELDRRKTAADAIPAVREMLSDLIDRLDRGARDGLGSQPLLPAPAQASTAVEVRASFDRRRHELKDAPPAPEAADIAARIERTARRLARLRELPDLLERVATQRRLVDANRQRVQDLSGNPDLAASQALRALQEQRAETDAEVLGFAERQARLVRQRGMLGGGQDEVVLSADVGQRLDALGLDEAAALPSARARAQAELAEAGLLLASRHADAEVARNRAAERERALLRTRDVMASGSTYAWLRDALPEIVPGAHDDLEDSHVRLEELSRRVAAADRRLHAMINTSLAVQRAVQALGARLRGERADATEYVPELRAWLEQRFTDYFATDAVRRELLPSGARDLSVRLDDATLSWTVDNVEEQRPLAAFSSGEQAFAYTRARLALLDEQSAPAANRLLCLDEFGAFMADDRRQKLYDYLGDRAEAAPGDRVLLILPLRQDYSRAAETAAGSERARLERIAADLEDDGVMLQDVLA